MEISEGGSEGGLTDELTHISSSSALIESMKGRIFRILLRYAWGASARNLQEKEAEEVREKVNCREEA